MPRLSAILSIICVLASNPALAGFAATPGPQYPCTYEGALAATNNSAWWQLCQSKNCIIESRDSTLCANAGIYWGYNDPRAMCSSGWCNWYSKGATVYTCPANATLSGTTCDCNTGYGQLGSTCLPQDGVCRIK